MCARLGKDLLISMSHEHAVTGMQMTGTGCDLYTFKDGQWLNTNPGDEG